MWIKNTEQTPAPQIDNKVILILECGLDGNLFDAELVYYSFRHNKWFAVHPDDLFLSEYSNREIAYWCDIPSLNE